MKAPGVYTIEHIPSGRQYIGSSKDMGYRWGKHRQLLRRGVHHSSYMQRVWNKSSAEDFKFAVLIVARSSELQMYEQFCLDNIGPVFNSAKSASSPVMRGQKLPKQWVDNVQKGLRRLRDSGYVPPPRGPLSAHQKLAISGRSKRSWADDAQRSKNIAAMRDSMTPAECAAKSARIAQLWKDSGYREKAVAARVGNAFAKGYVCTPDQILNRKRAARISNMKRNYGEVWRQEYARRYPEYAGDLNGLCEW